MPKRPDVPCSRCGTLLWSSPKSLPASERLCRPCRAAASAPAEPTEVPAPPAPRPELARGEPCDDFGPRGRRLWRAMTAGTPLSPVDRVLLEEACRIADRCDQLDRLLRGDDDAWVRLHSRDEDGSIVQVVLDKALSESRQQALAYKAVVAELRASRAGTAAPTKPEASGSDELAKRRAERRSAAGL